MSSDRFFLLDPNKFTKKDVSKYTSAEIEDLCGFNKDCDELSKKIDIYDADIKDLAEKLRESQSAENAGMAFLNEYQLFDRYRDRFFDLANIFNYSTVLLAFNCGISINEVQKSKERFCYESQLYKMKEIFDDLKKSEKLFQSDSWHNTVDTLYGNDKKIVEQRFLGLHSYDSFNEFMNRIEGNISRATKVRLEAECNSTFDYF